MSVAVLLGSIASARGQSAVPLEPQSPPPLQIQLPTAVDQVPMPDPTQGLIRLDVTVTDKYGDPVTGLSQKDFTLLDNGQPMNLVTFRAYNGTTNLPDNPVEAVIVLDEFSMLPSERVGKKALAQAIREVGIFLRANEGILRQTVTIYRLRQDGLFVLHNAGLGGNAIAKFLESDSGQERLWNPSAVEKDIALFRAQSKDPVFWRISHSLVALGTIALEERRRPARKLLFWIGNGWQIHGRRAEMTQFTTELFTRLREARISIWGASEWPLYDIAGNAVPVDDHVYSEQLRGPHDSRYMDPTDLTYLSLPVVAARTGGGMLDVHRNLGARMAKRLKEANKFYSVTFDPPRTETVDEYHSLAMRLARQDLTAHTTADYFDEPNFYDQPAMRRQVSVEALETVIATARSISSDELAHQLSAMQLSERLSAEDLADMEKSVRGGKAREALQVLADESAFLPAPPGRIPTTPPPDMQTQKQIILQTISYIKTAIPSLPDFFATRKTVQYHEPPANGEKTWKTAPDDQSLHEGETTIDSIRFHDGSERVERKRVENMSQKPGNQRLETIGTFGPILASVITAATSKQSELRWSHWERTQNGTLAVFSYRVHGETRLFNAEFCCLAYDFGEVPFKKRAPFHGEIAVDPSSGAIMRLTIQADLEWRLPLIRSDVMVEYHAVTRGPRTFICPWRSVSISRQRRTVTIKEWGETFKVYGPFETLLNEMKFEKYKFFGSTSRILPGFVEVPKTVDNPN